MNRGLKSPRFCYSSIILFIQGTQKEPMIAHCLQQKPKLIEKPPFEKEDKGVQNIFHKLFMI